MKVSLKVLAVGVLLVASRGLAQDASSYKIIKSEKPGGPGGMDYISIDPDARKLFVPRGDHMVAFDADTLKEIGRIPSIPGEHGVAIDTKNGHAFISGRTAQQQGTVTVFDMATIKPITTINVGGAPDGIMYDPATDRVYVGSHTKPNITVINAADNSIVGTVDGLGEADASGNVEGCVSDGKRMFCNLENQDDVAVVDLATLKVTDHWKLGDATGPTGIGYDAKNHRLFSMCGGNGRVVCLNTDTGAVVASIPCGAGADSGGFNPNTMEAFSANSDDGTLTIVKENTPDSIVLEQNVKTLPRARSCVVDLKNNQVYVAGMLYGPPATQPAPAAGGQAAPGGGRRGGRQPAVPDSFTIMIVGKQ
jgi:DNA-binding beta-propeller fold protein YncE